MVGCVYSDERDHSSCKQGGSSGKVEAYHSECYPENGTMNALFHTYSLPGKMNQFWLVIGFLLVGSCANAVAQGKDITVICSTGKGIQGELLVATDSVVIVKIVSDVRNIWWQGDSAFAAVVALSEVQRIVIEGNQAILWGMGAGLGLGGGCAAITGARGGDAFGIVLAGVLAGFVIGGLSSHGEELFDGNAPGGFSALPDFARFGATIPAILKHLDRR